MFFRVNNKQCLAAEAFRAKTLMSAYFIIKNYPLKATELALDAFIQQQYNMTLKNLSVSLLLKITFYKDEDGNLILIFKDPKYDQLARLITYGNGAIPGSKILKTALNA